MDLHNTKYKKTDNMDTHKAHVKSGQIINIYVWRVLDENTHYN